MEQFLFNPIYNKVPMGAQTPGTKITYNLKIATYTNVVSVDFVCFTDTLEIALPCVLTNSENDYNTYSVTTSFDHNYLYFYYFKIVTMDETFYLQKDEHFNAQKTYHVSYPFVQLIYAPETQPQESFKEGILYHIFVDRFCKEGSVTARDGLILREDWGGEIQKQVSNGITLNTQCFGGNLQGIIKKLEYLKQLNVNTIYLSPIFEAQSNHKYNTSDYSKIDSMFGGEKAFLELLEQAKKLNINIVLDGVFNHTGSDSVYFNSENRYPVVGACQSKDSPYFNWYYFNSYPNDYACWWGVKTLPETNDQDPSYVDYICGKNGILQKYMKMGVTGFRLDVVDELSSKFLSQISASIKSVKPDALIVGEVWEDASTKMAYGKRREYFLGGQLNSVTNYPVKNGIIEFIKNSNLAPLNNALLTILEQYPSFVQHNLLNFLNSHDTARILSVLGCDDLDHISVGNGNYKLTNNEHKKGVYLLKMASVLQYTLMGIPTVFYGDEAGIQGLKDPYCRACYPWDNINQELLEWYKLLGELRKQNALIKGNFEFIENNYNVLIFKRTYQNNSVIVAINKSNYNYDLKLTESYTNFFNKQTTEFATIKPNEFLVLIK